MSVVLLILMLTHQLQVCTVEIILDRIEQFGPTEDVELSGLKVRKEDGVRKLFGKWVYHRSFDDSYIVKVAAYKKTGAGWNLLPYKLEKPVCTFYNEDTYYYKEFASFSDFEYPSPCPLPNVFCSNSSLF